MEGGGQGRDHEGPCLPPALLIAFGKGSDPECDVYVTLM